MRHIDRHNLTQAVASSFALPDPRGRALVAGLVKSLHGFVVEHGVTHDEWRAALDFLTRCAAITTRSRNEFVLLSDVLGVSSLVDLVNHHAGATEGSVLGPFHNTDSLPAANGVNLVAANAGLPLVVKGRVSSADGRPVAGAVLDIWSADAAGLYPEQDKAQDPHNLRCKLQVGADGTYAFATVRPAPYSVPGDGPVGALLSAAGRTCMRAAHVHIIASAPSFEPVVTELFFEGGDYLDDDAVFGVRESLVAHIETCSDPGLALPCEIVAPFGLVRFDIRLQARHGA